MSRQASTGDASTLKACTFAIGQLTEAFLRDPSAFSKEAELRSKLSSLLSKNPALAAHEASSEASLVRQEYPTPFKCQVGDLRFEVLEDNARAQRGDYDLVVLNPWWTDKASPKALTNHNFAAFRKEIRAKAQPEDPALCSVGIELHLVRTDRPRLADYSRIGHAYRKLLLSGTLPNGWRFMDHRYLLVYSQHSQPHEAKWRELVQAAWESDVDPRNVRLAWTSPQGTRWSG
jgi:hypothetical protein